MKETGPIVNLTRGTTLAARALTAERGRERRRGLLGMPALPEGRALVIRPCRQIHTFGMAFAIDVVFIGRDSSVVLASSALRPGRLSGVVWRAVAAVELPAGTLERTGTARGDVIHLRRRAEDGRDRAAGSGAAGSGAAASGAAASGAAASGAAASGAGSRR